MQRLTSNQCQLGPGDFELVARCESGTTGRNRRAIVAWDFGSFETDQPHLVADAFDRRHRDTDATQRKLQLREWQLASCGRASHYVNDKIGRILRCVIGLRVDRLSKSGRDR